VLGAMKIDGEPDESEIDYEAPLTDADREMLLAYGWEISEDEHEARLYSEGWSSVQAAVFSTKWWIWSRRAP